MSAAALRCPCPREHHTSPFLSLLLDEELGGGNVTSAVRSRSQSHRVLACEGVRGHVGMGCTKMGI